MKRPAADPKATVEPSQALEPFETVTVAKAKLLRKKTWIMGECPPDPSESESPAEGADPQIKKRPAASRKPVEEKAGSTWSQTVRSSGDSQGG